MSPAQRLHIPCDRVERLHYIKRIFVNAQGAGLEPEWVGGRLSAQKKLNSIDVVAYAKNRNFLNGAVTHLSPYLRHGCVTLNEAFFSIKNRFGLEAQKLLTELAWRDYWRQVWYEKGDAIYSEIEPPKVAIGYAPLSDAIVQGKTGLPCMDAFINDLLATGYVHNHARMWLASYIVHHLKMDWRAAADWFEQHLLDGDIASNHLSWQWVASTFSSKPYYFNKENISRYTGERYCANCKATCPFDDSYEVLNERLFNQTLTPTAKQYPIKLLPMTVPSSFKTIAVYVHDEMLSGAHDLLKRPFPKMFVFDPQLYGDWSLNRLQFVADCLSEMNGVEVWLGDTYEVLMDRGVGQVITQDTPNKKIKALLEPFAPKWQPEVKLVGLAISDKRLKRFSRYWEKVGPILLGAR
ncbi:MAG: FAD-binding domain-containing protein [Methylotenera sp.]|nr:FAD-binding domain-containing protein [Methylotenera sp.]MDO9389824.1 FAD-binding domain-containing protein [Methylotenera sp.]